MRVVWNGRGGWTFLRPEGRAPVAFTAWLRPRGESNKAAQSRRTTDRMDTDENRRFPIPVFLRWVKQPNPVFIRSSRRKILVPTARRFRSPAVGRAANGHRWCVGDWVPGESGDPSRSGTDCKKISAPARPRPLGLRAPSPTRQPAHGFSASGSTLGGVLGLLPGNRPATGGKAAQISAAREKAWSGFGGWSAPGTGGARGSGVAAGRTASAVRLPARPVFARRLAAWLAREWRHRNGGRLNARSVVSIPLPPFPCRPSLISIPLGRFVCHAW